MLTSKEQTFPTTGIAGGFLKLKRTRNGVAFTLRHTSSKYCFTKDCLSHPFFVIEDRPSCGTILLYSLHTTPYQGVSL